MAWDRAGELQGLPDGSCCSVAGAWITLSLKSPKAGCRPSSSQALTMNKTHVDKSGLGICFNSNWLRSAKRTTALVCFWNLSMDARCPGSANSEWIGTSVLLSQSVFLSGLPAYMFGAVRPIPVVTPGTVHGSSSRYLAFKVCQFGWQRSCTGHTRQLVLDAIQDMHIQVQIV